MLVDDAGDPSLRTSGMPPEAMIRHGLLGRGVACHARALALYPEPSLLRLIGLAGNAGLVFVPDPHTGPLPRGHLDDDALGLPHRAVIIRDSAPR